MDRQAGSFFLAGKLDAVFFLLRLISISLRSLVSSLLGDVTHAAKEKKAKWLERDYFHRWLRAYARQTPLGGAKKNTLLPINTDFCLSSRIRHADKTFLAGISPEEKYFKPSRRSIVFLANRTGGKGVEGSWARPLAILTTLFARGITRVRVIPSASD